MRQGTQQPSIMLRGYKMQKALNPVQHVHYNKGYWFKSSYKSATYILIKMGPQSKVNRKITHRFKQYFFLLLLLILGKTHQELCNEVKNLHSTDDRETSQQSKCSSNSWQSVHKLCWSILGDLIVARSVKIKWNAL